MKTFILMMVLLLPLVSFSQTKKELYNAYVKRCNIVNAYEYKQSGYLKYDTLVLKTLPTKPTYYNKVIVNKIKVSPTKSIIVTVDTVWLNLTIPKYVYSETPPKTSRTSEYYNKDYKWVYRKQIVSMKRVAPVSYSIWTKNVQYYDNLLNNIESNISTNNVWK